MLQTIYDVQISFSTCVCFLLSFVIVKVVLVLDAFPCSWHQTSNVRCGFDAENGFQWREVQRTPALVYESKNKVINDVMICALCRCASCYEVSIHVAESISN